MLIRFQTVLEHDQTPLRWTIARVPYDPLEAWPERRGLRVRGTIQAANTTNSYAFRTSLFGTPKQGYILLVNKQMQKGAGVIVGSLAEIELEPDLEERAASIPPELGKLLKTDRSLKRFYTDLPYSYRKDIADTITEPKSPEARARRAEQLAERMLQAIDGEREAPPILQAAFRKHPQARAGWEAMTAAQRRSHLMGIFGYQSPESRAKRAQKTIDEALKIAERKG